MSESIEAIEIGLVLEAMHARYGVDLRGYVESSLQRRMRAALARSGYAHFGELQHRLLHDPAVFAELIDDLAVQVTEMFRDPEFFRAFRERVVPFLQTYPEIKVWHAGCATGEEAYTIAILLDEHKLYERTQIYGTDISERAIARARQGVYPEAKLDAFTDNHARSGGPTRLSDHYVRGYGNFVIRDALRKNVVFFQHNLVSDYALGTMHVIFCRNVLMYLNEAARARVLDMFCGSLCRGGFLCLGASESLPSVHERAFRELQPNTRIYQYRGET